ncbi:topoisomerase II-associated protein PAT1 [Boletus edulis]|nr:topoisomerase II-associated protein PAT1 [Boletus edulis]
MSFFDFEASSLEQNLESGRQESEDLAVYTWGEESYDGLGDALQEGGDELNNETFGGSGAVGKDFDFTSQTLLDSTSTRYDRRATPQVPLRERTPAQERTYAAPKFPERGISPALASAPSAPHSLESIWDDRSPFSMLRGANGAARVTDHRPSSTSRHLASPTTSSLAHGQQTLADHHRTPDQQLHQPISHGANSFGARTVQEIEAEMRLAAQQARQRQELELRQRERELRLAEEQQLSQQQQQQQQLRDQDRLRLLQLQQQQLIQQEQQLRLHQVHQQQVTPPPPPPPRMVHHTQAQSLLPRTQSPRFHQQHQHQQQILMLQQEQERQQQERLKELQERLRMEELERQLRAQQLSQLQQQPSLQARRQASYADLQALQQRRTHSPAGAAFATGSNGGGEVNQQDAPFLPQSIQLQQRLLSEMAQAEFMRDMQGISQAEQEALRAEAMRKIMETERMEEKRRRKASKIAYMSRYNDLMTQSDKDFITRIQVSQLVTQDPYAEDFYAQVYGAILRSRMGQPGADSERVLKFGSGGGVGLGMPGHKTGSRRPSAMQKMETQVERIVSNARMREREKGMHSLHSLQGALGKTSGRSYKAAPRQLLQVDSGNATATLHPHISREDGQGHSLSTNSDGAVREAAKLGREALGDVAGQDGVVRKDPLTRREVLVAIESLYDCVLNIEQLRRNQPFEEDDEAVAAWQEDYESLVEEIWVGLNVLVPLETSDPHPFISLLTTAKGKRILPRLSRHIQPARMLTLLTLLVACFSQLDVVKYAHLLDLPEDSHLHTQSRTPSSNGDANPPDRDEVERQTQAFLGSVLQSILPVVAKAELRLIAGLLGLLLDRSDVVMIAQTRPGIAILTLFMSRVEIIKQGMSGIPESEVLTPEDAEQWQLMFDHLFQLLAPHFLLLFPSTRRALQLAATPTQHNVHGRMPPQSPGAEMLDQPVWQFLAALALHASTEQQSTLVAGLREKVLENVASAQKGWGVVDEEEREAKLANVNLFLHALGLDSSQITI